MSARRSISLVLVWLCAAAGVLLCCSAAAFGQRMHEFSFAFGSEGSGNGQLKLPGALAVNEETGDVYVIDRTNSRVEIFSASGAYVGQFNGSATPAGNFLWPFDRTTESAQHETERQEGSIAVDNSTNPLDPSKGDVYVVDNGHDVIDKFSASGAYIGQITGAYIGQVTDSNTAFAELSAVEVDSAGSLWVTDGIFSDSLEHFNDAAPVNGYVSSLKLDLPNEGGATGEVGLIGLAFGGEGNVYLGDRLKIVERFTYPTLFSLATGEAVVEKLDDENASGLAVDESSGDVYVDHETSIAAYDRSQAVVERFGSGQLGVSEGIAVDSKTGTVYATDASSQQVDVFTAFVVPDATTGVASSLAETSAMVGGVINPDGLPVTSCVFEYGTSTAYGQSAPCSPSPGSVTGPVAVSAQLSGLVPLTKYHYRVSASNANGVNHGQDQAFVTPAPVALSEEIVTDVSSTSALFNVQVNPGGAEATYHFEFGSSEAYGESVPVPAGDLGSETSGEPVSVRVEGLSEATTYHVRVVASNLLGTVYGPDLTFTTQAVGGAFVLPDGREWELVSPPNKEGALILPIGGAQNSYSPLIEASADGGAFSFATFSPLGADPLGNSAPRGLTQVLASHSDEGWSSQDIATPHQAAAEDLGEDEYRFFSPDLSQALVQPEGDTPLSPEATETTPYVRDNASEHYTPLVTTGDVPPGTTFGPNRKSEQDPRVVAVTPDFSHVLFLSPFALTGNAKAGEGGSNLYAWSGGQLQLVNVLPDGTAVAGQTELGGGSGGQDTRNALSQNGSRAFFSVDKALYMHNTVTGKTLEMPPVASGEGSGFANFQIASSDGSKVFYLGEDANLYVCQVVEEVGEPKCDVTDLSVDQNAGEDANVQRDVVGAAEDGSVVYFVANGKLAVGAESGKENLYVESETGSSWSAPKLIAILSEADSLDWAGSDSVNEGTLGEMNHLTSRVSPSGRYLTFMSDRSLTGYDNRDAVSGQPDMEVFLYDEATGQLRCVSCNPTGERPEGVFDAHEGEDELVVDPLRSWPNGQWLAASIPGWTQPGDEGGYTVSYQSRVLSDEGRMFFDSADALVAQDTNGKEDVYEYEPVGVGGSGGCTVSSRSFVASAGGCVSLVSSGTSSEESVFLDASEGGGDVFFLTTARLVGQDVDSAYDVYDAHVCSAESPCVSAPVVPPPCTSGDACKAAPSLQPAIFGAPSSATFSGLGNVAVSQTLSGDGGAKTGATKRVSHAKPKPKPKQRKPKSKKRKRRAGGKGSKGLRVRGSRPSETSRAVGGRQ